jgi:uncharacterized protein (DUF952 family)
LRSAERRHRVFPRIFAKIGGDIAYKSNYRRVPLRDCRASDKGPMTLIYKICPRALWQEAERVGVFRGAPVDHADGFIHFSTAEQVRETAAKHFSGEADLLLVAVDAAALGPALRWEPSRGGALFPHLYGTLSLDAVRRVDELPLGRDGHVFPQLDR